jgi:hypothetical protein
VATANLPKRLHGKNRVRAGNATLDLFGHITLPEGMKYQPDFLSIEEERVLLREVKSLPFREFEFHGFTAGAAPFPMAGVTISTAAGSQRPTICRSF